MHVGGDQGMWNTIPIQKLITLDQSIDQHIKEQETRKLSPMA